jgi:lipid II:glycine glycyltransferase (peptidoglycan interpeptide bridge formation enzyme)
MITKIRNHHTLKTILLSVIILLFASNFAIAEERVSITIDGESYSREMPKDYEAAVKLIRYLAELERNADLQAVEVARKYEDSMNTYENEISKLYDKISSLESSLSEASEAAKKTEKDINKMTAVNSRCTISLNVGPVFSYDSGFVTGVNTGIIFDYRILRNFHIGGNIFLNSFSTQPRPFELGVGLILGYSPY